MSKRLETAASALKEAARRWPGHKAAEFSRNCWVLPLQVALTREGFDDYVRHYFYVNDENCKGRARRAEEREIEMDRSSSNSAGNRNPGANAVKKKHTGAVASYRGRVPKQPNQTDRLREGETQLRSGIAVELAEIPLDAAAAEVADTLGRAGATHTSLVALGSDVEMLQRWGVEKGTYNRAVKVVMGQSDDRDLFPLKQHIGARTKVNIFFKDACKDFSKKSAQLAALVTALIAQRAAIESRDVYNDEATSWLLWIHAVWTRGRPWIGAIRLKYSALKRMSDQIKGMGVAVNDGANLYVELQSLAGRSIASVAIDEEMAKRCEATSQPGMLAPFSPCAIREAVRKVVAEERATFEPPASYEEFFTARFATTKAGSHHAAEWDKNHSLKGVQMTRRNYVESLESDYVNRIAPGGYVSFSEKLECGKTRAIYSLDSDNYLRFDAPARALEAGWLGKKANLNPSRGSVSEDLENRMGKLKRWKLMLDYADFNSAHTIAAQKIVVEEAFAGLDAAWLQWLVDSFDHTYIRHPTTGELHKSDGTLMSGHRMTSIINTILNAAYIRLCVGEELYCSLTIEHVGDDIVASLDNSADAARVVEKVLGSGLNMQKEKQGFGEHCAEFLRMSYTQHVAVGYLARTISTLTCGSWVTEKRLNIEEYCSTVSAGIWALRNRSMSREAAALMASTLVRRLGLSYAEASAVCRGGAALNSAPIFAEEPGGHLIITFRSKGEVKTTPRAVNGTRLPRRATVDYTTQSREYYELVRAGVKRSDIDKAMLEASYSNVATHTTSDALPSYDCRHRVSARLCLRRMGSRLHVAKDPPLGVLANLLKGSQPAAVVDRYIRATGLPAAALGRDWVRQHSPVSAWLGVPFSDASRAAYACPDACHYMQEVVVLV